MKKMLLKLKKQITKIFSPGFNIMLILFLLVAFLCLTSTSTMAQSQIPFFLDQFNLVSDNSAGYLINKPGSNTDDVTLDIGDRLRGVLRIETIEDLTGGGGTKNLLSTTQPTEFTAIYDVTVVNKILVSPQGTFGPVYRFIFGATPVNIAWVGLPGPLPKDGTMVRFYEDSAKNFSRLLSSIQTDDGDPTLIGADIGKGPFAMEEQIATLSTDGMPFWDLGFTGSVSDEFNGQPSPAPGEGWESTTIDNVLIVHAIPPPANGGTINIALNLKDNFIGPILGTVPSYFGGYANVNGSTNLLGISSVKTPYDFINDINFALRPLSPRPCIDIEKEISVDNGTTWLDADSVGTAAKATAPHGALYRLKVCNCGNVDLTDVVVTDPTLGINHTIGNLAAGACVTLTSTEIPALNVPVRCQTAGNYDNTACVEGTDPSGVKVSDCDPAWLVCTSPPCIDLEKEISIDNGTTWMDADTVDQAAIATAPHGAMYRLIVKNCGFVNLFNVTINDAILGISNYLVGNLAAGASVTLTSGEIPKLDVPERCKTAGQYDNTACVSGLDANGVQVSDCDPAWLVCTQAPGACRMTGGNVTVNWDYVPGTYADVQNGKKKWYTVGGQVGAPQANDPSYGEWTHTQHAGFEGSFTFHAGTNSAPDEALILSIKCADPGWCVQARCAPFKQIFWDGIGVFKNEKGYSAAFPNCNVDPKVPTLHYFRAHASDFGEPGNNGKQKPESQCEWKSGGPDINNVVFISAVPDPKFGDKGGQYCDLCPDYYEIEIHCTTNPASPIIYKIGDFIDGGNLQIHPEVGQQCPY